MEKRDFNIDGGNLSVLLKNAREIVNSGTCIRVDCINCPLDDNRCTNCSLWMDCEYQDESVSLSKKFIKLFGGKMTDQKLYQKLQKLWVEHHNLEVGDVVRVVGGTGSCHLGGGAGDMHKEYIGKEYPIDSITDRAIYVNAINIPFFCLEFVRKAEKKVEMTVKEIEEKLGLTNLHVVKGEK